MENEIRLNPIGIIHTPYTKAEGIFIQGKFNKTVTGKIEVFEEYKEGLKDLSGFSHLILIYYFNQSKQQKLIGNPFLEDKHHGIFAIRHPDRPNHLGFSIVKIKNIKDNIIIFSEVDIFDKTPLLDIKPYVSHFDSRKNVKNGWIEKHFKKNKLSNRIML
jgi:tRNA-Thr(GGU) m(6)t(6)A37 methyltransferase TsaA